MWRALKNFGVPGKIINLCKMTYDGYTCQVIHNNRLSDPFPIRSGVRQGCLLSPIIFLMVLDGVMRKVTSQRGGIQWGLTERLEDIDFADDLCLMAHKKTDITRKLEKLQVEGSRVGLKINMDKTKEMRLNSRNQEALMVGEKEIERVEQFQYLGSIISTTGGTEEDVSQRIRKAKGAYAQLTPIWRSQQLKRGTKLRIFETNVKSVLLYGCQTWKVTKTIAKKLQVFINRCLRGILRIHWPETITNEELWRRSNQCPVSETVKKRKYGWLGHTLRRAANSVSLQALEWNPQGSRKRGRPRMTWRRTIESELREEGKTWREVKNLAQNRVRWRAFVAALRPPRDYRT